MPNYITHSVMGEVTRVPNDKIEIDKNFLKLFSLGQDLMFSRSGLTDFTHSNDTAAFFMNLIKYIKDNELTEDSETMAFLYGHIMHYELDKNTHPYVYYMTNDVPKCGIVNFHMAFEEYLGDFVLHDKLNLSRKNFMANFRDVQFSDGTFIPRLVDDVYFKTYDEECCYDVLMNSCSLLKLLNHFRNLFGEKKANMYFKFLGLDSYLKKIDLKKEDIPNTDKKEWYNPISRRQNDSSFMELFDVSVSLSQEVMEKVDRVVYDGRSLITLENIFDDTSYDTGLDCSIGEPFSLSRYKTLQKKR